MKQVVAVAVAVAGPVAITVILAEKMAIAVILASKAVGQIDVALAR